MAGGKDIRAGKAFIEMYVNDSKLQRGLAAARRRLRSFGKSVQAMGKSFLLLGGAIAAPFVFAINAASRMEETMNKFNVVFGANKTAVKAWGDEFAGQVGRSKEQIASFLAGTQDLLVPVGFEEGAATDMSKQLTTLAVDLASFNNLSDKVVLRDLHAALTGGGETMKKYGVIVSAAAVKLQLLKEGLDPAAATDQQKVMARMTIIMAGTTAAQGDATRSAGSFANQMKALKGSVDDAAVSIGAVLLPIVTPLITWMVDVVKVAGEWIAENQNLVLTIAAIGLAVLAFGAVLITLGAIASGLAIAMGVLTTIMSVFGVVMAFVLSPITLVVAAIVALAAAVAWLTGFGTGIGTWLKDLMTVEGPDVKLGKVDTSEADKAMEDLKNIKLDDAELNASLDANTDATMDASAMQLDSARIDEENAKRENRREIRSSTWGTFSAAALGRFSANFVNKQADKDAHNTAKNTAKLVKLMGKTGVNFA